MNEQKYYVKSKFWNGGQNYFTLDKNIIKDSFWSRWINPKTFEAPQQQFTKQELAEIMGGVLYEQEVSGDILTPDHVFYGSGKEIVSEWINPLIELVPVEEEA